MRISAYSVALITRGTGAYTYTFSGPPGLTRGRLCAINFRQSFELGVITGSDPEPPAKPLQPLLPITTDNDYFGPLLLELAQLSVSGPDEVAGHLLFASPGSGIKLELAITKPGELPPSVAAALGELAGKLAPKGKKRLCRKPQADQLLNEPELWEPACLAAWQSALVLKMQVAGLPRVTRESPRYRKWFSTDPATLKLLGLAGEYSALPGSYLAGFAGIQGVGQLAKAATPEELTQTFPAASGFDWEELSWPQDWEILKRLPELVNVPVRRHLATWPSLRQTGGLASELSKALAEQENVLLIAPQAWLLDRLWPQFAPLAPRVHRYHSDGSLSEVAYLLGRLAEPGQVIAGGPGAWKLAAHGRFTQVLLLDPSHPQYAPEREPGLDPRLALLASLAHRPARLNLIELGLSVWGGRSSLSAVTVLDTHSPTDSASAPDTTHDPDPLPLLLRQPTRRRLIYFNRLGSSRGLCCVECNSWVSCPTCGSSAVHYSRSGRHYRCGECGTAEVNLRCPTCGLATFSMQQPGLEAVVRRKGELLATAELPRRISAEVSALIGTSNLLEPLSGFWPEDLAYVHAEQNLSFISDWPQAIDTAARLGSLYANPELTDCYIVSSRIREQLGEKVTQASVMDSWETEQRLRALAKLPPFGVLYRLSLISRNREHLRAARELTGSLLKAHPDTTMLRLGRPYARPGGVKLAGWLSNQTISYEALQDLRWQVHRQKSAMSITALTGPWL